MTKSLDLIIFLFLFAKNVFASEDTIFPQQVTAKELLKYCASSFLTPTGRTRREFCYGFVSGVEETERFLNGDLSSKQPFICLPKGNTAYEYAKVFIQHANKKKTDLNRPAVIVVMEALEENFRCK